MDPIGIGSSGILDLESELKSAILSHSEEKVRSFILNNYPFFQSLEEGKLFKLISLFEREMPESDELITELSGYLNISPFSDTQVFSSRSYFQENASSSSSSLKRTAGPDIGDNGFFDIVTNQEFIDDEKVGALCNYLEENKSVSKEAFNAAIEMLGSTCPESASVLQAISLSL